MIKYVFAEDSPLTIKGAAQADPQVIGAALEDIRTKNGGEIKPTVVVESARSKKNPLHAFFEWNDQVAAECHRLDQARSLIRCVRIVDDDAERGHVQAFVSVNASNGVSYRSMDDVRNSGQLRAAVLVAAERDLEAWTRRYRELVEACEIVSQVAETIRKTRTGGESRASA